VLDPDMKKGLWTQAKMKIIQDSQKELGNKWSEIAKRIPGQNENSVKNQWYNQKTVRVCCCFFVPTSQFSIQHFHYDKSTNHLDVYLTIILNCRRTRGRLRRGVQRVVLPVAHSLVPSKLV
jgi:hypothetical protein